LTVTPSNACGNGPAQSVSVTVVTPYPTRIGPISGPSIICRSTDGLVYSVPYQPGVTYNWYFSPGVVGLPGLIIVSGQGTNSITANAPTNGHYGHLIVTAFNGCNTVRDSLYISTRVPSWTMVNRNCQYNSCTPNSLVRPPYPCTGNVQGHTAPYRECHGGQYCVGQWLCTCW
jgi:hypothetical protein